MLIATSIPSRQASSAPVAAPSRWTITPVWGMSVVMRRVHLHQEDVVGAPSRVVKLYPVVQQHSAQFVNPF